MASISEAWRDMFYDKFALIKLVGFAILVNYGYTLFQTIDVNPFGFYILVSILAFFMYGTVVKITHNIISESIDILPSFNPLPIIEASIKGIIAMTPVTVISVGITLLVCNFMHTIEWIDYTVKVLVALLAMMMILSSFLMFCSEEKIKGAFDFSPIVAKAGDLLLALVFFIIKLSLLNAIVAGFVSYTLIILFGFGPILNFFLSFMFVLNLFAAGDYFGQIYYELIEYDDTEWVKKSEESNEN